MVEKQKQDMPYLEHEISWLSFNERVLQEAADPSVPIIQRIRYLGIFSNNLDEYYRVRVANVRRLISFGDKKEQKEQTALLKRITNEVQDLQDQFKQVYRDVLYDLRKRKIYLVNENQLDEKQSAFVESYFDNHVLPQLAPTILKDNRPIHNISDEMIYLAIRFVAEKKVGYAILEIPTNALPRFIEIPQAKGRRGKVFIVLENIIRRCLKKVFRGIYDIEHAEAYTIKITRDAELELDETISQSFIDKMSNSLKQRKSGDPTRFIYDKKTPDDLLKYLLKNMGLDRKENATPGGRYHNSKDFISFPNVGPSYLEFKPLPHVPCKELEQHSNLFQCIKKSDALLYYPYHSFKYITDLLQTAALDPAVTHIKITLYRVAKHSKIIQALANAVHNHKQVTCVVELQARFDEAANIGWAKRLTEYGINVISGVPGLKVHSKLIQIEREEEGEIKYYSHIGTGNFNEKTANIYTDFSLLTYDQKIGQDVAKAFDFIQYTYKHHQFDHLFISPLSNRSGFLGLIDDEIKHAKAGRKSGIIIKCNNLVDHEIVAKLYEASNAGVKVKAIIRGMCSLIPGVKGFSENIEAISIVDRFLEHPRVYIFENDNDPKVYLSSADLMTRNLDYRIEVSTPVYDKKLKQTILDIMDIQWADNVKARDLADQQANKLRKIKSKNKIRSQEAIHRYLGKGKLPRLSKSQRHFVE